MNSLWLFNVYGWALLNFVVVVLGLQFLQFCPTILEPNFDLNFFEAERRCQMFTTSLAQVRIGLELGSQRCQLGRIEISPGPFFRRSDGFYIRRFLWFPSLSWTWKKSPFLVLGFFLDTTSCQTLKRIPYVPIESPSLATNPSLNVQSPQKVTCWQGK